MTNLFQGTSQFLIVSLVLINGLKSYALTPSSEEQKVIEEYNKYIKQGRRQFKEYKLPICEFASWHPNSPKEKCITLWTGWCWADKSPEISVYDKPNGNKINALRNGRLLSPKDEAGNKIPILIDDDYYQVGSWTKVFGPYRNQYRYWGWVERAELGCEP
jgi:hypothetical protein